MGGVPARWRTLTGDSKTDPEWASVLYRVLVLAGGGALADADTDPPTSTQAAVARSALTPDRLRQ